MEDLRIRAALLSIFYPLSSILCSLIRYFDGRLTVKVEPRPTSLCTTIVP
jgi:hypothetical protein